MIVVAHVVIAFHIITVFVGYPEKYAALRASGLDKVIGFNCHCSSRINPLAVRHLAGTLQA